MSEPNAACTGDQLSIAKETGRRLGMGTNMYPSSSLLGHDKDENDALPDNELIEKADGFAGVYPGMYVKLYTLILLELCCDYEVFEDIFTSNPLSLVFFTIFLLFPSTFRAQV